MRDYHLLILTLVVCLSFGLLTTSSVGAVVEVNTDEDIVKFLDDVYIPQDQVITGDLVSVLGDIKVDGQVNGDLVAVLGDIELNNRVGGQAVSVLGTISQGTEAIVEGGVTEVRPGRITKNLRFGFSPLGIFGWGFRLLKLLVIYGLAVLVMALLPEKTKKMAISVEKNLLQKLVVGTGTMAVWPILSFGLAISIIGIPLVPLAIASFFLLRFLGFVAVALFIGGRIKEVGGFELNLFVELLLGIIVLELLGVVPLLNLISWLLITILSLGVVVATKFGTGKPWFETAKLEGDSE